MTENATTYPPEAIGHDWTPGEHDWRHHHKRRFSWQPVAAGIAAALAVQIVLGLFGAAFGFASVAFNPTALPSQEAIAIGVSMWAAVSILSALFYGGFIAARLSKSTCHHEGVLHGIVTWAGTILVIAFLLSSTAAPMFGGASQFMGHFTGRHFFRPIPGAAIDPETRTELVPGNPTAPPVEQAKMAAERAATAKASLGAAVVLLLGAFTSALGGSLGIAHVKHDRERHLGNKIKV